MTTPKLDDEFDEKEAMRGWTHGETILESGSSWSNKEIFAQGARWQYEKSCREVAELKAENERIFAIKLVEVTDHPLYVTCKELEAELKQVRDELAQAKYEIKIQAEYIVPMGGISTKIMNELTKERDEAAKMAEKLAAPFAVLINNVLAKLAPLQSQVDAAFKALAEYEAWKGRK